VNWPLTTDHGDDVVVTARCYASALYDAVRLSIGLSVCLSQAGTVPKWLDAESRKQRLTIDQGGSNRRLLTNISLSKIVQDR